ncbi:MAG: hypothetical protein R2862_11960 [Thermoanaerobaculia bacterium]
MNEYHRHRAVVGGLPRGLSTSELRRLVARDATRAYSVLMRDQPEAEREVGGMRGVFRKTKLFLSISAKLTPARRLLFAIGVGGALIGILGPNFVVDERGTRVSIDGSPFFFVLSIAALLFLLVLELVDRVLVRDELQVARQLQRDLLPSADPRSRAGPSPIRRAPQTTSAATTTSSLRSRTGGSPSSSPTPASAGWPPGC